MTDNERDVLRKHEELVAAQARSCEILTEIEYHVRFYCTPGNQPKNVEKVPTSTIQAVVDAIFATANKFFTANDWCGRLAFVMSFLPDAELASEHADYFAKAVANSLGQSDCRDTATALARELIDAGLSHYRFVERKEAEVAKLVPQGPHQRAC